VLDGVGPGRAPHSRRQIPYTALRTPPDPWYRCLLLLVTSR